MVTCGSGCSGARVEKLRTEETIENRGGGGKLEGILGRKGCGWTLDVVIDGISLPWRDRAMSFEGANNYGMMTSMPGDDTVLRGCVAPKRKVEWFFIKPSFPHA